MANVSENKLFKTLVVLIASVYISITPSLASVSTEELFPFGTSNGDTSIPLGDDGFAEVALTNTFIFFNETYERIFVNMNGGLSFRGGVSQYTPTCGPLQQPMIVAFWADIDIRNGGNIFYRETADRKLLAKAESQLQKAFPNFWKVSSSLGWLFIVTWDNVAFYKSNNKDCFAKPIRNTFQLTVASDGIHSFVIFYYNNIEWTTGTSSGGDSCTGLNGTPAKAGFDYGDGKTFYEIGSSCTPNIVDIELTTNINDPGKWIFRIDNSVESAQCEKRDNFDKSKRLTIKPAFVRLFGHIPITLSGPCLLNVTRVSCRFNDPGQSSLVLVNGTFDENGSTTICEVPILYGYGRIKVELIVEYDDERTEEIYFGYLFCMELEDDTSVTINAIPDNDDEVEIDIQWNPEYFLDAEEKVERRKRSIASSIPGNQRSLQLSYLEYETKQGDNIKNGVGKWKADSLVIKNIPNTGRAKKRMKRKKVIGSDENPGKVISYKVGFRDLPLVIYEEVKPVLSKAAQMVKETFTPLLCTNTLIPFRNNIKACNEWYKEDHGAPNDILPCPPLLRQAQEDPRFQMDEATGEVLQFFHPGADVSYRQKIPSPKGGGQQCTYKGGKLLVGLPGGGTADRVSPNKSKFKHWFLDVLPWCQCCAHSNDTASCRKYYEKRPSDPGDRYSPPRNTRAAGDPHISTFDSTSYTFNGLGEFWMVKTVDDSFSMQARMEQFTTEDGKLTNASIFTAFVMQEIESTTNLSTLAQILIKSSGIILIIDGEVISFAEFEDEEMQAMFKSNPKTIIVNGITITEDQGEFTISFSTGFSFIFSTSDNKSLDILGSADESLIGKVQGLLGDFDKNSQNDLITPEGIIIPISSSIERIHYDFGLKWMIKEDESLFEYSEGESYSIFKKEDFQPNFISPNISELPIEITELCGDSMACLYDYSTTGSLSFANSTKQVVEHFETIVEVSEIVVSMCDPIGMFENGFYEIENYFVDSEVKFYCNDKHELVGQNILRCEPQRSNGDEVAWNYDIPYCSGNGLSMNLPLFCVYAIFCVISFIGLLGAFFMLYKKHERNNTKPVLLTVPRKLIIN